MRRPIVAGNWKMNGLRASLSEVKALDELLAALVPSARCDTIICPPATLLAELSHMVAGGVIKTGGQTCSTRDSGAYTGEESAHMLRDAGADFCIVGHSERRHLFGEKDDTVHNKALAARRAGLIPIVCVGEPREVRDAGDGV